MSRLAVIALGALTGGTGSPVPPTRSPGSTTPSPRG